MEDQKYRGNLGDRMKAYRVTPPDRVWEGVAAHLDGGKGRRRLIFWFALAAGIALAVTTGITLDRYLTGRMLPSELAIEVPGGAEQVRPVEEPVAAMQETIRTTEKQEGPLPVARSAESLYDHNEKNSAAGPVETTERENDIQALAATKVLSVNEQQDIAGEESLLAQSVTEQTKADDAAIEEFGLNETTDPDQDINVTRVEKDSTRLKVPVEILSLPVLEFAENTEQEKGEGSRWKIMATLSPLYSYRDASGTLAANSVLNNNETGLLAYAGGVRVAFDIRSGIEIETGLLYNKMGLMIGDFEGYLLGDKLLYDDSPEAFQPNVLYSVTNSIGEIISSDGDPVMNTYGGTSNIPLDYLNQPSAVSSDRLASDLMQQSLEYLEIPFNLRYTILDRDLEMQVIGGFSTNILVGNNVSLVTDDGLEDFGYVDNLRFINYSGNAGLGLIYHLNGQLALNMEPRFRYYLNSVNVPGITPTRPYNFGLFTGLSYLF